MYQKILDEFEYNDMKIPPRMHEGIINYLEFGILPGQFLRAVICNDLKAAVANADDENKWIIPVYVVFFYNEVPAIAVGSKNNMHEWCMKYVRGEDPLKGLK